MNATRVMVGTALGALLASGCMASGVTLDAASVPQGAMTSTAGGLGPISAVLGIEKYFPMQRTYTWTYAVTIAGATTTTAQEVTRIDSVSESAGTKTATYTSTRQDGETLLAQGTGTITQSGSLLTIAGDGGTELISLPLQSGKEWVSGTLTARSFAVERLTVQGKTYKDVMAIAYSKDGETKAVRWLAPDVGIVKQLARLSSDGEVVTLTSELKAAKVSAVTSVSLSPLSLALSRNATGSVSAQVRYDDGSLGREYTLSLADPGMATVTTAGLVTAGSATGSTVLTARSTQDSTKTATMSLIIN